MNTSTLTPIQKAIVDAIRMLEAESRFSKFDKDRTRQWIKSLSEFDPREIKAVAKYWIENIPEDPRLSRFREEVEDYRRINGPQATGTDVDEDPFPEASDASDLLGKALGAGGKSLGGKMLRIQMACMTHAKAAGVENWQHIGKENPIEERAIRERIQEFDGVPYDSIPALVNRILEEIKDPFANER
jgi:hypothetical protein